MTTPAHDLSKATTSRNGGHSRFLKKKKGHFYSEKCAERIEICISVLGISQSLHF